MAPSTVRTRQVQWKSYLEFCGEFGFVPLPASPQIFSLYVAHLFDGLEFSSINNHLAAVAPLHSNCNIAPPDLSHPLIRSALDGARRQRTENPHQKRAITAAILELIASHLAIIDQPIRDPFWAAAIVAFFSLSRSADLFAASRNACFLMFSDA